MLFYIKQYFDMLNNEETEIYYEYDYYIVHDNNKKKYILFLNDMKPALIFKIIARLILLVFIITGSNVMFSNYIEEFIMPSFILRNQQYQLLMEKMRSNKLYVFLSMYISYNIIYAMLCQSNIIHIYQNQQLILKSRFNEELFMHQMNQVLMPL